MSTQGTVVSLVSALRNSAWSGCGVWQNPNPPHPPPRPYPERRLRALLGHVPLLPDTEDHLDASGKLGTEHRQAQVGAWPFPGDRRGREQGWRKGRGQMMWK